MALDFIPKPKSKTWQIINFVLGLVMVVLAVFYIFSSLDLVPDALGPLGYIDDVIVLVLALFFANRFWKKISGRFARNKEAYKELWRKGDIIRILTSGKFLITILIIGGVTAYFIWGIDLIPDGIAGLGYADDALVAIGGAIALIRLYWVERK